MPREPLALSDVQRDRAVGVLLATAAGDALGAGYEFGPPVPADEPVGMIGGGLGPFVPGEWTDDTAMAIAIAETASTGADLTAQQHHDDIVARWAWWARTAKDVGAQTRTVLTAAGRKRLSAKAARAAAAALHAETGWTAGNGSLMRTAPVALANLGDPHKLQRAARAISDLTHADPDAGDACVLWCAAIRHAVLTGKLDVRIGLTYIPDERRQVWAARIGEAEQSRPADFTAGNGWVVAALQGAWSAISTTPVPADDPAAGVFAADHLRLALEAAVRGGGDTDTVAAIAGGLLGAAYGASALPWQWRLALKGWPGLTTHGLVALADRIINGGEPNRFDHTYESWRGSPPPRRHPHDDGLLLGAATTLPRVPRDVGAVVSLCRVADGHIPDRVRHLEVRLIDRVGANANLDLVLLDTVRAIDDLRAEGLTVFLHSLTADGRTLAVAALYGARRAGVGVDAALEQVCAKLPDSQPNREFRAALRRLEPATGGADR